MTRRLPYVVVRVADSVRGERLNAGIAIFDGLSAEVRTPKRLDKLRAMSHALDLEAFKEILGRLPEIDRLVMSDGTLVLDERLARLRDFTALDFSEPAWLEAPTHEAYEAAVGNLLKHLVEPEPGRVPALRKRSRLLSVVKKAFAGERVLAKKGEDLSSHRIVTNFEIAEGLQADFILKNGAMHIVETVDASDDQSSARKIVSDIAVSALVLEQARMTFGETVTRARLVYDASPTFERLATPSLEAAAHQGTELVNWASGDDRRRLLVELASLATPVETKSAAQERLTATTQRRLSLH
jgi:hypothetical protein